jgi:nitrous oxide reductase accessory protein NosL
MTNTRFGKRLVLAACAAMLSVSAAAAQQAEPVAKAGKPINVGDILSGELNTMRVRSGDGGKRVATYQITSEPRRLPPPSGLCNLETGPETFQLLTTSDAQAAQLKKLAGKQVSIRVDDIACAQEAGQMSEAVVKKWSLVTTR